MTIIPDRKIKCPYCGWVRAVTTNAVEKASTGTITRGNDLDKIKNLASRIKSIISDSELNDANKLIDTKCPHCFNVYQYNVLTGTTKK